MKKALSTQKRKRRRNDPAGLQARILDRAAKLFQERGFHATSMHDIMTATGVSAGELHHHFPSKKSLALEVLKERVRPAVREAWIKPIREISDLGTGITAVFTAITDGITARGSVLGCPLNNLALELALSDAEFRSVIDAIFAEWRTALGAKIAETRQGARLDGKHRAAAANFIISVYSGAMNMAKASQSATPLADAAGLLETWLKDNQFTGA